MGTCFGTFMKILFVCYVLTLLGFFVLYQPPFYEPEPTGKVVEVFLGGNQTGEVLRRARVQIMCN